MREVQTIKQIARRIERRLHKEYDLVIAIDGDEGEGKSDFSLVLGKEVDKKFDLVKSIAYLPTPKEMVEKFHAIHRYGYFDVDEAVKVLHKHDWANKLQQMINKMYATERWQNKCTALLIPKFTDLNPTFRNHRVKFWIHIITRGVAVLFTKSKNTFSKDPWNIDENKKIIETMMRKKTEPEVTTEEWLDFYSKTKNYVCEIRYEAVDEATRKQYDELKKLSRLTKDKEEDIVETPLIRKYRNLQAAMYCLFKRWFPKLSARKLAATINQEATYKLANEVTIGEIWNAKGLMDRTLSPNSPISSNSSNNIPTPLPIINYEGLGESAKIPSDKESKDEQTME